MNKKKILMVISTLNTGGAQKVFSNMIMGFPEEYQIDILLNDTKNLVYPYRGRLIDLGLKSQTDKTSILYQIKLFWKRFTKICELKRKNHYDVCISALTSANAVNALTKYKGCKNILTVHSFMSRDALRGLKKKIQTIGISKLYNLADAVVVVSESARRDLIENFSVKEEKTVTIYNGYPIEKIMSAGQECLNKTSQAMIEADGTKIVTVGRLTDAKGQWHLIRAMSRLREQIPDIRLFILGDGELKDYFQRLIRDYGLEENVFLMGFQTNPYKIMSKCDCLVMPSIYEGFPNALVEALALGLPCVSADFDSGAREILAPDTPIDDKVRDGFQLMKYGILCPVCDGKMREADEKLTEEENYLADAVVAMINDKSVSEKYRKMGKERADELSIEKIMTVWIDMIETMGA